MNRKVRKVKLISRNVLESVAYYSRFNPLYKKKTNIVKMGSIIFVVGKSPMDLMEPILYRKKVP